MKIEFNPVGLIRIMDDLGRIAIPKEFREVCNAHPGDGFEIFSDGKGNFYLKHIGG